MYKFFCLDGFVFVFSMYLFDKYLWSICYVLGFVLDVRDKRVVGGELVLYNGR